MPVPRHDQQVVASSAHNALPQSIVAMHGVLERLCWGLVVADKEVVLAQDLDAMDEVVGFEGVDHFVVVVWVENGIWEALFCGVFDIKNDGAVAGVDIRPGCVGAFESVFVPKAVEEARVEALGADGAETDCWRSASAFQWY